MPGARFESRRFLGVGTRTRGICPTRVALVTQTPPPIVRIEVEPSRIVPRICARRTGVKQCVHAGPEQWPGPENNHEISCIPCNPACVLVNSTVKHGRCGELRYREPKHAWTIHVEYNAGSALEQHGGSENSENPKGL